MKNLKSYLLAVTIIIMVAVTNKKAIGQLNTRIVGVDTICIGQSSTYSVNVNTLSNKYLFRDTTTTGYLGIGDVSSITNTFSYDIWVKPTRSINMASESNSCSGAVTVPLANSNQNWALRPVSKSSGNMGTGLTIGTNGIMVAEHSQNLLVSRLSYSTTISDWVHVAVVYRTDSIFLYLNGSLVRQRVKPCFSENRFFPNILAAAMYSPDFKGNIDEFRLWDIALTPQDVMNIKDKKLINKVDGLRYYASFDNEKFERTLGDLGDERMTVVGLTTEKHIKSSSWDLDKYSGANTSSLAAFNISELSYLWSTGSTSNSTVYVPVKGVNYLTVNTFNDSYSKTDTITIFGKNCDGIALSSGLIAYYPFNGNANDESGNNLNGTVNGALLTTDRFGKANSAYSFDGNSGTERYISSNIGEHDTISFSVWFKSPYPTTMYPDIINYGSQNRLDITIAGNHPAYIANGSIGKITAGAAVEGAWTSLISSDIYVTDDEWHFIAACYIPNDSIYFYLDNKLVGTSAYLPNNPTDDLLYIGRQINDNAGSVLHETHFNGSIDDIRIYNRKLNKLEIANLFFGSNMCTGTIYDTVKVVVYDTITRVNNRIQYLKFESYYSADDGQVNVYEIQAYSESVNVALNKPTYANSGYGASSAVDGQDFSRWEGNRHDAGPDSLNPHFIVVDLQSIIPIDSIILNIKGFDSWKQVFDLSVSSDSIHWNSIGKGDSITGIFTYIPDNGNIVIVNDTIRVTVTDTLIIDVLLTDVQSKDNINTIKVYPNPTKDYLYINTGDFQTLNGYSMKIINQLGATEFQTNIENALYEINLSSWSGKGLYFIQIIDSSDRIIDIRKIVLQ